MLVSLIIGALIGWVAGKLMNSRGGLLRNILLGIVGSSVGHYLAGMLGINATGFGSYIVSVAGACLVIWVVRKIFR